LHDDALYRNLDRLRKDLERLKARLEKGPWTKLEKLHPAIGRRQEGYPRVARYNRMGYHAAPKTLRGEEEGGKQALAAKWEGGSVRKTDRQGMLMKTWESMLRKFKICNMLRGCA
jgi:hypothetical protein